MEGSRSKERKRAREKGGLRRVVGRLRKDGTIVRERKDGRRQE